MTAIPTDPAHALLTTAEASQALGVTMQALTDARHERRGPGFLRVGKHVRYRPDVVHEHVVAGSASGYVTAAQLAAFLAVSEEYLVRVSAGGEFARSCVIGTEHHYRVKDVLRLLA